MESNTELDSHNYIEPAQLEELWDQFLELWPLERLESMSLEEYTSQGTDDSFCYWIESATDKLGSIWGGSAFKFGVYARKDTASKVNSNGRCYNDHYGWMSKYGDTPEEAFSSVKAEIIKVANAAREGVLETVNHANLGEAIRWKIAFLYQNRNEPKILPVFTGERLSILTGKSVKKERVEALDILMKQVGTRELFEFSQALWQKADELMFAQFNADKAQLFFDESEGFQAIKPPTKYIAGYELLSGKQIALVRNSKTVSLFLQPGTWVDKVRSLLTSVKSYSADEPRSSNLEVNAPQLAIGQPSIKVTVDSLSALQALCSAYDNDLADSPVADTINNQWSDKVSSTLNQVLYGPPGTGKTYATTEKAVELADPKWMAELLSQELSVAEHRSAIKQRYDDLVADGRIAFTTFHQSFSYEDFIEGIRAETKDDKVSYNVEDGIFKALAALAAEEKSPSGVTNTLSLDGRRVWKMSLGNTLKGENEAYEDCIENNYISLGWGGNIDFSQCEDRAAIQDLYSAKTGEKYDSTSYNVSAVNTFKNVIRKGDIVIVSDGNHKFRAIAEVKGDYYYSPESEGRYFSQCRSVRWLRIFETSIPKEALFNKSLSQMTLYELKPSTIKLEKLKDFLTAPTERSSSSGNYVLIIDEINRGNISRIFGELITLLEPDKRKGASDERSVILPYSKDSFSVPDNLIVLGTMNTADKSLAQLDLALRRRFEFVELMPKPQLLQGVLVHGVDVSELLQVLNQRIEILLDRDHTIGHAYFWPLHSAASEEERQTLLANIFAKRIIPLLQEYFFSDWERIGWVLNDPLKPAPERFIELNEVGASVVNLFPPDIASQITDRRYRINDKAFNKPGAYQGILSGVGVSA
ncbi:AAA family ATPase [Bermanella sp. R86510]|uniref:AAA family ATPase n=1 Tax=unclassified Bermanella TaxID=2627862 RepID=UPI0037CAD4AA